MTANSQFGAIVRQGEAARNGGAGPGRPMSGDSITIARAHDPKVVMAKVVHLDEYGIRDVEPSPHAFLWNFDSVSVRGLSSLADAIQGAAPDPYAVALRAAPLMPIGRRAIYSNAKYGEHAAPGLVAVARQYVGFDFDNIPDANTVEDDPAEQANWDRPPALFTPQIGAEMARRRLPPEFRAVRCLIQVTASAGYKPGYRFRLWFWLDHLTTGDELKTWCRPAIDRGLLDPVTLRDCQEHYLGVRTIGGPDPCPKRFSFLDGIDVVKVPDLAGIKRRQDAADQQKRRARQAERPSGWLPPTEYVRERIDGCIAEIKAATEQKGRHPIYLKQVAAARYLCDEHNVDWPPVREELADTYESLFSNTDAARRRKGSIEGVPDWIERRAG
jgi:hypothetical protein